MSFDKDLILAREKLISAANAIPEVDARDLTALEYNARILELQHAALEFSNAMIRAGAYCMRCKARLVVHECAPTANR